MRFKAEVKRFVQDLARQGILHETLLAHLRTGYLALYIECFFETPLQRDLDNGIKITIDALMAALGDGMNDNRVVDLHVSKRIRPLDPYCYVEIDVLEEWEFEEQRYVVYPAALETLEEVLRA